MKLDLSLIRGLLTGATWLANEAQSTAITLFLPNQLAARRDGEEHWVQLSPFGDFGNVNGAARVIQRFRQEDATRICNEFNSALRRVTQPLGMPFYIGHPDHPRFAGQPGHGDTRAYGRGKEMQVRHDAGCAGCAAFANARGGENAAAPCQEHGLFVRMHWNDEGARLIANESFHGHSVNWAAVPGAMENGVQIYRPVRVKSAGFTNEPNIPVRPASLANEAAEVDARIDELEELLANERRARAAAVVDGLVRSGRVLTKDREGCVEQLCNAGDGFEAEAARLGNARVIVKTAARSRGLAGQHARVVEGERERTARFQQMMDAREREFPNENYEERFRIVANSNEGAQLLAQMSRAGATE